MPLDAATGSLLVTVTGPDRPGVGAWLFGTLAGTPMQVLDVEQLQVHGQLLLCVELDVAGLQPDAAAAAVRLALGVGGGDTGGMAGAAADDSGGGAGMTVTVQPVAGDGRPGPEGRHLVTALAPELGAPALHDLFGAIAACGASVLRVVRLATYPVHSYELEVAGARGDASAGALRRALAEVAARRQMDVAVQRAGLHRRAKHLIVLDADSTLLQGEVIDLLARRAGRYDEVAAVTAAAMAGRLDFAGALAERVALLAGLPESAVDSVVDEVPLAPGARTLVRTLRRLGYVTAVVSGGFTRIIEPIAARLGIDYVAANTLDLADGRLTGRVIGPVLDRAGKAAALVRFAGLAGVPLTQTVAVGDGANDIDMLAVAGLGIAFNAKPVVRQVADATISVPYLDAILFLLGIPRTDVEAADRETGGFSSAPTGDTGDGPARLTRDRP